MPTTGVAMELTARVGRGMGLQYDAYHMGAMGADIVRAPREFELAHVQIADHPGRHEPGTGGLPLRAFLEALATSGYDGFVGLEWVPRTSSAESLSAWRRYLATVRAPAPAM